MNCRICGKPVILQPSAQERAKKFGGRPKDYTRLFTVHGECAVKKRQQETLQLIRRITQS